LALEKFEQGLTEASINIGSGSGYSNLEILKTIEQVTGLSLPYEDAPRRAGDVSRLFADASNAKSVLGFEPVHSNLENIIKTAWDFQRKRWAL